MAISASPRDFPPSFLSGGRTSSLVPDEAHQIVGKVRHADLGAGAGDADGADEEFHLCLLTREDVLDESANL